MRLCHWLPLLAYNSQKKPAMFPCLQARAALIFARQTRLTRNASSSQYGQKSRELFKQSSVNRYHYIPRIYTITMIAATLRQARRISILVIGGTVVLLGIILIFIPGPALLVIPAGLLILSTEFLWAKRLLNHVKEHLGKK